MISALGLIEVKGFLGAIEAADAALKAANVHLVGLEKVKGGLVVVKIKGDVSAVCESVEAGKEAAKRLGVLFTTSVISRIDENVLDMLEDAKDKTIKDVYEKDNVKSEDLDFIYDEGGFKSEFNNEKPKDDEENIIKELEEKTVEELRRLARSLKMGTMTNKQIKFARKDKLIEEIKRFYQRRDK